MKDFSDNAMPGACIADTIPPLADIMPVVLQWWRARGLRLQARQTTIWMKYWSTLQKQIDDGKAPECFVKQFSESNYKAKGISDVQAAYVAGSKYQINLSPVQTLTRSFLAMIEAGSETTSSALNSVIMYLAAAPEIQRRAREELLSVIGTDRTPTFDDEQSLPYIRATVKEILRMRPAANVGSLHRTTAEVVYKDMVIPKGTIVTINQYALHYDPERYEDPYTFNPARYLNHPLKAGAYTAHPDPYARDHFTFGAGRRVCPGMHLAENSLYIVLAKMLWAFEIRPPLNEDGSEATMDASEDAFEGGANTLPKPYRVRFIARDAKAAEVVRSEWSRAKEEGFYLGAVKVDSAGMVLAD